MADSYNKTASSGPGTLVENWFEERHLRDMTGHSRNYPMSHVSKTKEGPVFQRPREGTEVRVLGTGDSQTMSTFNYEYGRSKNPADSLRKMGRREQLFLEQIRGEVLEDHRKQEEAKEELRNQRYFDSTTRTTFDWKVNTETVGQRVMKDQDGGTAVADDEAFAVEHGLRKIQRRKPREELEEELKCEQVPVTLYSDSLRKGIFPISATSGGNPFAKTSGFTQPLTHTKAAVGFAGNLNGQH